MYRHASVPCRARATKVAADMAFETALSGVFVVGYGYVARGVYETYQEIERGKARRARMAMVSPLKKRKVDEAGALRGTIQNAVAGPSRYRNQLGRKPGKYGTRRNWYQSIEDGNEQDKKAHFHRLISAAWSENETQINKRRGQLCNVVGVKVRMLWEMKATLTANANAYKQPIQIRWAVVNPKENSGSDLLRNASPNEFWIDADPTSNMYKNWTTTGNCMSYTSRKINRDAWGVLREGTFVLCPNPSGTGDNTLDARLGRSMGNQLNLWIPVRRQMSWTTNDEVTASRWPEENIYFVWWYCKQFDSTDAQKMNSATADDIAQMPFRTVCERTTFFKNSQMFA